jgi:hypothetical protein
MAIAERSKNHPRPILRGGAVSARSASFRHINTFGVRAHPTCGNSWVISSTSRLLTRCVMNSGIAVAMPV